MILGLKQGDIKLVPHEVGWKDEFLKTQKEIHEATGIALERIEHIGSTSIKDIKAKPMIDFVVGVDDINNVPPSILKALKEIDFHRLRVVLKDEIVIAKFTDKTFSVKTHIIHLVNYKGDKWNDLISFREALNSSKKLREEYEKIKLNFTQHETGDMNDYTNYKEDFILTVLNKRT